MPRPGFIQIDADARAYMRSCRIARGWSQELLAEKVDISQQQISACERGLSRISVGMLERLGTVFGKTFEQFLAETRRQGFSDTEAQPYVGSPSDAASWVKPSELMFLDLNNVPDPVDRMRLRKLYEAASRKP